MSKTYLLDVKKLSTYFYVYEGVKRVLDEVDLQICPGEIFGLVGESGSGKTVTAHSVIRLISSPGKIVGGNIFFQGKDLLELSEEEFRQVRGKEISMIFQQSQTALNPFKTIGEQIARVYRIHEELSKPEALKRTIEILKRVAIPEAEKRVRNYPHEFSLGMSQRVMIALMIACNPRLLIADEPTTGLDVTTQAQILDLMKETKTKLGMSVLLITHDLGVAAQTCNRIGVMHAGHIVEVAEIETLFEKPQHPYTQSLLNAIPRVDKKVAIKDIPGVVPNLINPPQGCRFVRRCPKVITGLCEQKPQMFETEPAHLVMCHLYSRS